MKLYRCYWLWWVIRSLTLDSDVLIKIFLSLLALLNSKKNCFQEYRKGTSCIFVSIILNHFDRYLQALVQKSVGNGQMFIPRLFCVDLLWFTSSFYFIRWAIFRALKTDCFASILLFIPILVYDTRTRLIQVRLVKLLFDEKFLANGFRFPVHL